MEPDQHLGQPGEVLHEADQPLCQLDHHEDAGGPPGGTRRTDGPQGEPEGDGEPDQQEHRVGVHLRDDLRVEPRAPGVGVAGVRPAARHDDAEHDDGHAHQRQDPGERPQRGGHGRTAPAGTVDRAAPEGVRHGEHADRGEEVEADDPRVEVGQHGDPTDHALHGDDQEHTERQEQQRPGVAVARAAVVAPGRDQGREGDRADHPAEHAVGELDDAVDAHLPVGDVGRVGAAGPRRAPEAGSGQPDGPAGDDDRDVGDDGGERQAPEQHGHGEILRTVGDAPARGVAFRPLCAVTPITSAPVCPARRNYVTLAL